MLILVTSLSAVPVTPELSAAMWGTEPPSSNAGHFSNDQQIKSRRDQVFRMFEIPYSD